MKTKLLAFILVINSFWSAGQQNVDQRVEVGGLYQPDQAYSIERTWNPEFIGLFAENEKFYLKPTIVDFEEGINDCTLDSTITLAPKDDHCIFLFSYFTGYNTVPIEAVEGGKAIEMTPGKSFHFKYNYNDIDYILQADGEIDGSNINNYTLSFCKTDCQTEQILVAYELIESTVVQILFIGDLDGDGEPDIILDAPTNYENKRIMLFLFSTKQENELLHLETEKFDWFDC
jgi:hypothetical protein